jgi:chemotaxis protein MotA
VIFLPVGARLKALSAEEMHFRHMTLEGIMAIQAGDNPRVVAEKLLAYVPPAQRPAEPDQAGAGAEKVAA